MRRPRPHTTRAPSLGSAHILFQHQLIPQPPVTSDSVSVFLVEDPILAGLLGDPPIAYSGLRIAYDGACCELYLTEHPHVTFISAQEAESFYAHQLPSYSSVRYFDPHDKALRAFLDEWARQHPVVAVHMDESPCFLMGRTEWKALIDDYPDKTRWLQHTFYSWYRRRHGILMDPDGKPLGGKFSMDAENRHPFRGRPQDLPLRPSVPTHDLAAWKRVFAERKKDPFWNRLDRVWPDNPAFFFPTSRKGALRWLRRFVAIYLPDFGRYQDAMLVGESRLFHSTLSPLLNRGLLLPREVLHTVLQAKGAPLSSIEGFVRQLIGWREYSLFVYEMFPPIPLAARQAGRGLHPKVWYQASSGLVPLDDCIARAWSSGYSHHIERLIVLGGMMLLLGVSGDRATQWFLEPYLDAYPWVMSFNVERMVLYLDRGDTTSKPYATSSKYIRRMSNYPPGEWTSIWDALYTHYVLQHRIALRTIRDYGLIVRAIENLDSQEKTRRIHRAQSIIAQFTQDSNTAAVRPRPKAGTT